MPAHGDEGLKNAGNTCWINAGTQSLRHTPGLLEALQNAIVSGWVADSFVEELYNIMSKVEPNYRSIRALCITEQVAGDRKNGDPDC
eukprot:765692-Hanusia_phi.AAC.8